MGTDEEKLACKLPRAAPVEKPALQNASLNISGASVGNKFSLADACAVLRNAAQREPLESSAAVHASSSSTPDSLSGCADVARLVPDRFTGEAHSLPRPSPPPVASCGA